MKNAIDWVLAIFSGSIIAVTTNWNSILGKHSSPIMASWVVHGVGTVVAIFFVLVFSNKQKNKLKAPQWAYFGGVPGAMTVILASVAVNSPLGLAGTLSLMLAGQTLFGIISDHFGWFGIIKRKFSRDDFVVTFCVLIGSAAIIFGGGDN